MLTFDSYKLLVCWLSMIFCYFLYMPTKLFCKKVIFILWNILYVHEVMFFPQFSVCDFLFWVCNNIKVFLYDNIQNSCGSKIYLWAICWTSEDMEPSWMAGPLGSSRKYG